MRKISGALVAVSLLLAVGSTSACGKKEEAAAPAALANPASDQQLLDAAGQYKALAQASFGAWTGVESKVATAKAAMAPVHGGVEAPVVAALDTQIAALDAAVAAKDKAGVALASAEIYKITVSKAAPPPTAPLAVSLMDYAGIRYDADRRATPPRWDDAVAAATDGRKQWESVARDFGDPQFQTRVGNVYNRMISAAKDKNNGDAAAAVKEQRELTEYMAGAYKAKPAS